MTSSNRTFSLVVIPKHIPKHLFQFLFLLLLLTTISTVEAGTPSPEDRLHLISRTFDCGLSTSNSSEGPALSNDGRIVVFRSLANDLVPSDTNNSWDVFVFDRDPDEDGILDDGCGVLRRASVKSDGSEAILGASGAVSSPHVSADGEHVVFFSGSSDLIDDDNNSVVDVFVHQWRSQTTVRVSIGSMGEESDRAAGEPAVSGDGRFVAFNSCARNIVPDDLGPIVRTNIFVHDRDFDDNGVFDETHSTARRTVLISRGLNGEPPDDDCFEPWLSGDGRFVAFYSNATNLVPGDTNNKRDIFVHDRDADEDEIFDEINEPGAVETRRVSVSSQGDQATADSNTPRLSGNGRYAAFISDANDLVIGDSGKTDVFVHDLQSGVTTRVSIASDGTPGTQGGGDQSTADQISISETGRFVTFESTSGNLTSAATGLAQIYVHDRDADGNGIFDESTPGARRTFLASIDSNGDPGFSGSLHPAISGDGLHVAFQAPDLSPCDTNVWMDIYALGVSEVADCQGIDDENVLFVNGNNGLASFHRVQVTAGHPLHFSIQLPSGGGNGKFVVHLNPGEPTETSVTPLPFNLGGFCFPLLLPPLGTASPVAVWNNLGREPKVGTTSYFGQMMEPPDPAPVTFFDRPAGDAVNLPPGSRWTLQGIIVNPNASGDRLVSGTNSIVIDVD